MGPINSSDIVHQIAIYCTDPELAQLGSSSKFIKGVTGDLWKERYYKKQETNPFFVQVPKNSNFTHQYAVAITLERSIDFNALYNPKREVEVDYRNVKLGNYQNIQTCLSKGLAITRFNASISSQDFTPHYTRNGFFFNATREDCPSDRFEEDLRAAAGGHFCFPEYGPRYCILIRDPKNPHLSAIGLSIAPRELDEMQKRMIGVYERINRENQIKYRKKLIKDNIPHIAVALLGVATKCLMNRFG